MPHGLFSVVVAPARRAIALGFTAAVCLGLSGLLTACGPTSGASQAPAFKGIDVTGAAYGRQLALTDMTGQPRILADYRGKVLMLYFGFVQCPDVCPTALARASEVMQQLGPQARFMELGGGSGAQGKGRQQNCDDRGKPSAYRHCGGPVFGYVRANYLARHMI